MDAPQFTSLRAALAAVPDPRHARGQRYPWPVLLTLIAAALVSGQQGMRGIAQWVSEHATELGPLVGLPVGRVPSAATLRRTVRTVDVGALEARLATFVATLPPPPPVVRAPTPPPVPSLPWIGVALDGKAVRGANRHGAEVFLVSLVRHQDAAVLGQTLVAEKSNEITAAPPLLDRRDLTNWVITMDALLAQTDLATQIRQQGGHYLMVVKTNQPELYTALERLFTAHFRPAPTDWAAQTTSRAWNHGRLEVRTLERSAALNDYLDWPGVGQVLRRCCQRVDPRTGEISTAVTYGITSLLPTAATPEQLERLWRGHWTIENRVHYVRDRTFGEDACQVWAGQAPQALAAVRNGVLSLLRSRGWRNIADALRHYGASVPRAIQLLTADPTRL